MPETQPELVARLLSLGGDPTECGSSEELKRAIAAFHLTPDHLPQIAPMLAVDASEECEDYFDNDDYLFEPKIDEIRMLMFFHKGRVRFQSRGRHKATQLFHECTDNFPQFFGLYDPAWEGTVVDGGIVAGIKDGDPVWKGNDLGLAMSYVGSEPVLSAQLQAQRGLAKYVIFDMIRYRGEGVTDKPLEDRRILALNFLAQMKLGHPQAGLLITPQWGCEVAKTRFSQIVADGGEGLMMKLRGSAYVFKRNKAWLKAKRYEDLIGFVHSKKEDGKKALQGLVGSLNIADAAGKIIGGTATMTLQRRRELSLPNGDLNPAFVGRKVIMRIYAKHEETGNPRHARLVGWVGEGIAEEETVKEEVQ